MNIKKENKNNTGDYSLIIKNDLGIEEEWLEDKYRRGEKHKEYISPYDYKTRIQLYEICDRHYKNDKNEKLKIMETYGN